MKLREIYEDTFRNRMNEFIIALCDVLYTAFPTRKVELLRYRAINKSVADWYEFRNEMLGR